MSPNERRMREDMKIAEYYLARAHRSAAAFNRSLMLCIRHDGSLSLRAERWDDPVMAPGYSDFLDYKPQIAMTEQGDVHVMEKREY